MGKGGPSEGQGKGRTELYFSLHIISAFCFTTYQGYLFKKPSEKRKGREKEAVHKVTASSFLVIIKPLRHFLQDLMTQNVSTGKNVSEGKWKIMVICTKNVSPEKSSCAEIPYGDKLKIP